MKQDITHSCRDYLNDGDCISEDEELTSDDPVSGSSQRLTAEDRAVIVDWCYSLIDICQLDRSNVVMAISIADRFMSNPNELLVSQFTPYSFSPQEIRHNHTMFQLLAVSALYITIKITEQIIFSVEMLVAMTRGMYTVKEIETMERTILECLEWKVSTPTALEVGYTVLTLMTHQLQDVIGVNIEWIESIVEDVVFQTESAVRDYHFVVTHPCTSTIAIMVLVNAINDNEIMSEIVKQLFLKALFNVLEECKRQC